LFDQDKLDTLPVVKNIYLDRFLVGIVPGEKRQKYKAGTIG
jgi:hypothetical protein